MPVIRKLFRVGNSLTVGLPAEVRQHLGVNRGDYLVWYVAQDNRVILEKLTPKKHPGFFISQFRLPKYGR